MCTESTPSRPAHGNVPAFEFKTSDPCAASGYTLQEGARYRIWIEIGADWYDNTIKTDVEGFSREQMSWPMYFGLPFRRWLAEPGSPRLRADDGSPGLYVEQAFRLVTRVLGKRGGDAPGTSPPPAWAKYEGLYRSPWRDTRVLLLGAVPVR